MLEESDRMEQDYFSQSNLAEKVKQQLQESAKLKVKASQDLNKLIADATIQIFQCFQRGNKVLIFGNGGSAADAQHFAGELVGICRKNRKPLAAMALTTNSSVITALSNDFGYSEVFARQIEAIAKPGDLVIGISTSGNSKNVIRGVEKAKELNLKTIGLLGRYGGELASLVDLPIIVPNGNVLRIQEVHITILHIIADLIEKYFLGEKS